MDDMENLEQHFSCLWRQVDVSVFCNGADFSDWDHRIFTCYMRNYSCFYIIGKLGAQELKPVYNIPRKQRFFFYLFILMSRKLIN